jgi:acetate kinase
MNSSAIIAFLAEQVDPLRGTSRERLRFVVESSRQALFEANETIFYQGDAATHLGVVLSGAIEISVLADGAARKSFGELHPGATFNEMALITGDAVLADFIAMCRCEVLLIPVSVFQSIIVTEPGAVQYFSRAISDRMKSILPNPAQAPAAPGRASDPFGLTLTGDRPEKILVINCGSSSLKYSFYDTNDEARHCRGVVERIGISGTRLKHHGPRGEVKRALSEGSFAAAFKAMLTELTAKDTGVLCGPEEVSLVVHRVVHGGEKFTEATLISDDVLGQIEALSDLAPLHNPINLAGIREMRQLCPAIPHVAVFDSAFHHTLPAHAYLYGLPYELYEKSRIRRYGFHGTSHKYVSLRAAQFLGRRPSELRLVTCHLGNGSSICAVDHGRSVDTSMGLTPLEGLIMGTRCGDVDAGVLDFLSRTENLNSSAANELLNQKSGLLGLSGISSDMREILRAADEGSPRAQLAFKAYCYRVRKYIGSYVAAMGGIDALVFTGGIGQGSAEVRAMAVQGLECMGISLDFQQNLDARGFEEVSRVSIFDAKVAILVVPTDEERMMAREALRALSRSYVEEAVSAQNHESILVEVSAHHIHLKQEHVEALFGQGHQLTKHADTAQPGQYACEEQLTIIGPKGRVEHVRVLGPTRRYTQVEIAMTEQFKLGIHPPVRESGDIADSPGCTLEGSAGNVTIDRGVICPMRHIHMSPADALRHGVRDKSVVQVRIDADRELVFGDVLVRVDPSFALVINIDTDEAKAANVCTGARGHIQSIQHGG